MAGEHLAHYFVLAAHVTISGRFEIHRLAKFQRALDGLRPQVEQAIYATCNLAVGHIHMTATIGIHKDIDGASHTDGVAHLHEHLVGNAGSHHVLGDVASCIGCRTVHLRRVFAREGTASVSTLASVGIDNDLTARQSRVTVRSADDELTRGIDMIDDVVVEEGEYFFIALSLHAWNQHIDDIVFDLLQHECIVVHELVVLRGYHDGVDALRNAFVAVFNGHLTL